MDAVFVYLKKKKKANSGFFKFKKGLTSTN